jgi:Zn finger protein HypA/HybF involved in hydrogenase expression
MQCQYCGDCLDTSGIEKVYKSSSFTDEETGLTYVTEIIEQDGQCPRCGTHTVNHITAEKEVNIESYEYL